MLKTKAILRRKDDYFEPKDCVIEKVIRLNSDDFQHYCGHIQADRDFIKENSDICGRDQDGNHRCLLVIDRDGSDGILIQSEGYDYARYSAYVPGARYFVEACQETQSMKLFCPLNAETYEDMDEYEQQYAEEGAHVDPEAYEDYIRDEIAEYNRFDDERGLALYLENELKDKIWSIIPDVEMVGDTLYGVFKIELTEELTSQDLDKLRDYCSGQASDGWGEGFEQREIDTSDGEIYVHFWHSGDDYFMLTEDEFEMRMIDVTNKLLEQSEKCHIIFDNTENENSDVLEVQDKLNIQVNNGIVKLINVGMHFDNMDGDEVRYEALKSGNIGECMQFQEIKYGKWFIDDQGDFRALLHNRINEDFVLYRAFKDGVTDEQKEIFYDKAINDTLTNNDIDQYTFRLGDEVARIYGLAIQSSAAEQLGTKIEKNFAHYFRKNMELSLEEAFNMAREIAMYQDTYNDLLHTEWDDAEIDTLMSYENPLELISNIRFDSGRDIRTDAAVEELMKHPQLGEGYALDENYSPPDQSPGMSM